MHKEQAGTPKAPSVARPYAYEFPFRGFMGNGSLRALVSSDMPSTSNALELISGSL